MFSKSQRWKCFLSVDAKRLYSIGVFQKPTLEMFFVHRTCARDITCVPPAYMPHRAYTRDICVQPRLGVRVSTLFQMQASIMPTCPPVISHVYPPHACLPLPEYLLRQLFSSQSISYDERDCPFKKEQWVIFYNLFWVSTYMYI